MYTQIPYIYFLSIIFWWFQHKENVESWNCVKFRWHFQNLISRRISGFFQRTVWKLLCFLILKSQCYTATNNSNHAAQFIIIALKSSFFNFTIRNFSLSNENWIQNIFFILLEEIISLSINIKDSYKTSVTNIE